MIHIYAFFRYTYSTLDLYLQFLVKVGALSEHLQHLRSSHQVTPLAPSDASVPCPRPHDLC